MAGQVTNSVDRCVVWGASKVTSKDTLFLHEIVKVKVTLEQLTKSQSGSRGLALLFL